MISIDKAQFGIKENEREMPLGVSIGGPLFWRELGKLIMEIPPKLKDYLDNNRSSLPPITDPDERLHIDSLGVIRLVAFLETDLGIRVEDEELIVENFETLRKLGELIATKTSPSPTAEAKLPSN
jgi:acyl carrier protein